jgi:hypothetical protein
MKIEKDITELKNFSLDFQEFFDGQIQEIQFVEKELKKSTQFFKSSDF